MVALPLFFRELIEVSLYGINLPYTILLILCIFYWIFVILGAVELDGFDFDFDLDGDIDVDLDMEVGDSSPAYLIGLFRFLNLNGVPFMVFFSFFALSLWIISILGNYYLGGHAALFALLLIIPNLFLSALAGKVLSRPFVPLFKNLDDVAKPLELAGDTCEVVFSFEKNEVSQGRILKDDDTLLVSIMIDEMAPFTSLNKGDKVTIYNKVKQGDSIVYTVSQLPKI